MRVNKIKKSREGAVSLLKFLFTVTIFLYHAGNLLDGEHYFRVASVGYILVDFFFMVSGFYFYQSVLKLKEKNINIYQENVKMIGKKFIAFLPYTIIAGIVSCIIIFFHQKVAISSIIMSFLNTFLFDMTGLSGYTVNGVTWYLSAMLIIFFLLCPIIYNYDKSYKYYICPLIIMFGLGYMAHSASSLDIYMSGWNGFFYLGLVRALVDINLGILLYHFSRLVKNYLNNRKRLYNLLDVSALILYTIVFYYIYIYRICGRLDYFILFVLFLALLCTFSENRFNNKLDTKVIRYLEKIALPVYINQLPIITLFSIFGNFKEFPIVLLLALLSDILFSMLEFYVVEIFLKKRKKA